MKRQFCDGADHHLWEYYSDALWHCALCEATSEAKHPCLRCGQEIDIGRHPIFCSECQRELWEMQDGR